jgi:hypothetical protein
MRERQSRHYIGKPFWLGCAMTPFLVAFALWPFREEVPVFFWFIILVVFAGIVGAFMQAAVDLLQAQRSRKLRWLDYAFLALIVSLATAYGFAIFYFPTAEVPLRYGLAGAFPLVIAQLYARSRVYILRRGSRRV